MNKKAREVLQGLPKEGFIKTVGEVNHDLSDQQRSVLIRKGNTLYNEGKIDTAKRIFITTGYTDGLIRLGDFYYKNKQLFEAFRMYKLAPYKKSTDRMIEKMAMILQSWLKDKKEG